MIIIDSPYSQPIASSEEYRNNLILKISELNQNATINLYENGEIMRTGEPADMDMLHDINTFRNDNNVERFIHIAKSSSLNRVVETVASANSLFRYRGASLGFSVILFLIYDLIMALYFSRHNRYVQSKDTDFYFKPAADRRKKEPIFLPANYIPFNERTPEQKVSVLLRNIFLLILLLTAWSMITVSKRPAINPAIAYVLSGNWERGANFFSLTACGLVFFIAITLSLIIREFAGFIQIQLKDHRNAVVRLISTLLTTLLIVIAIMMSLYYLGLDVKGLFASAGIMAAIIGFGSKDLVSDILGGVTNVMTDKYRVGEVLNINGFEGKVEEITLRSVKMVDEQGNTKTIRNNAISSMVNESRTKPGAWIELAVPALTDLDKIKPLFKEKLEGTAQGCDRLQGDILFLGVTRFTPDRVFLGFSARCQDTDRNYCNWYINKEVHRIWAEIESSLAAQEAAGNTDSQETVPPASKPSKKV